MKITIEKARKMVTTNENKIEELRTKIIDIKNQIKEIKSENTNLERFIKNYEVLEQKFNKQLEQKNLKNDAGNENSIKQKTETPEETEADHGTLAEENVNEENQNSNDDGKDTGSVYDSIFK